MSFLLLLPPYLLGLAVGAIWATDSFSSWAKNMSFAESLARLLFWPIFLTIFIIKGLFRALISELSSY